MGTSFRFFGNGEGIMIIAWKDLSTMTKIFYVAGLVSAVGLGVMILTGWTCIGDILAWKWKLIKLCPWCM